MAEKKRKYVAIAGNIGAGKSSLTTLLGKNFGWKAYYESVDNNPYLPDFYDDMRRWSFNLQIYFLSSRFRNQKKLMATETSLIQDRTIYEDAYIFAPSLHEMGLMRTQDFDSYRGLFDLVNQFIEPPDLLIYLRASVPTLVRQIQSRGREYESSIRIDYLKSLNEKYEKWIESYDAGKMIVFEVDHLDVPGKPEDMRVVIEKIQSNLYGLFE